jgi:c-di-GMP-binding flagellar brake protein YcgR
VSSWSTDGQEERRASKRFSIDREIRYRVVDDGPTGISGTGRTVNLSSGGMLVVADRLLSPGLKLKIEMDWQISVDAKVKMKLVAFCTVVRADMGAIVLTALKITRHEFQSAGA